VGSSKLSEEMTQAQMDILACKLHKIKLIGYGEITMKIEKGRLKFLVEKTSYEIDISTSVDIAK
jgi:hypothetical protein